MEIIDLAQKKKAFAPPEERYKNPHAEAMKLRQLWSYYKPLSRSREIQQSRALFNQASKLAEKEEDLENAWGLIKKGLLLNPRFHGFYALKGDLYSRQEKWSSATNNYEKARSMTKFDTRLGKPEISFMYIDQLVECYTKRGDLYWEKDQLLEALGDYEQVLVLKSRGTTATNVQDKLLKVLRCLDKYVMFQRYWDEFMADADGMRTSDLLTTHAEYKIFLKEMAVARLMLSEALKLNKNNAQAQELLQVVYNTGHTMAGYTILWCMHGCYDKALVTIEKGLDCNPYNPGFTLLKAIVLRLSGRLGEANSWLENVSKNFYKLAESSKDTQESIMGKLTIDKTRKELIKQWYLIRYDEAVECMLNDKLETAARIIYSSKLTKYFTEAYILLGDSFFRRGNDDLALEMYLKCREKMRKLRLPASRNAIDVTERIIDILNDRAKIAVSKGHSKDAIILTKQVLRILDEDQVELNKLGPKRGCALLHKARGFLQIEIKSKERSKECCESAADSLRFLREPCDTGLYRSLYGNRCTEDTIDKFAPKRKLPRSLKILMQYS